MGTLILVGWALDFPPLKSVLPGTVSMKANTAACFVLLGLALTLVSRQAPRWAPRVLAGVVATISLLTLSQYLLGTNLGIDECLFADRGRPSITVYPGRMAPLTGIGLLLCAMAASLLSTSWRHAAAVAQAATVLVLCAAWVAQLGYVYRVPELKWPLAHTQMAIHTAGAFLLLGLGLLFARAHGGVCATLLDPGPGGVLARRLLPSAVLIPSLLGWVRLEGQRRQLYGTEFGLALNVIAFVITFSLVVWWVSVALGRSDLARRKAEEGLQSLNTELEERVARRTTELAAANRELEAFCYSVSHDLRAPLRGIDGFSQALAEDCGAAVGAVGEEHIARIRKATQRMGRLIDDLLSLSRFSRAEHVCGRVDLSTIAGEVLEELRRSQPERRVEVVLSPGLGTEGDDALLRAALENLLGNAWKFTSTRASARIEVGSEERNGERVFFVRDNGVGFDMAHAGKLFGAFQRLHTEREFPGNGIGLATVQRIIHRHGGRIWAEAGLDRGATFYFTLS